MSVSAISDSGFNFDLLARSINGSSSREGKGASAGDLFSSLTYRMAAFRSQALDTLTGGSSAGRDSADFKGLLAELKTPAATRAAGVDAQADNGLSATGRNLSLFDPESAYRMMSVINHDDVLYKAQYSEMSQMQSYVRDLQQEVGALGEIGTATADAEIEARLQRFVAQYNDWDQRFDADMEGGGLLADTQAAQVARYELKQSIENPFNGAADGLRGLEDLGLTVDPATGQASLDRSKLAATLAQNRQGAVHALQEFGANFAKSAELLNSAGNFIPNRLDNLDRVIHYIADNKESLQAEFGLGDPAKPSGLLAQALAAYNRSYGS